MKTTETGALTFPQVGETQSRRRTNQQRAALTHITCVVMSTRISQGVSVPFVTSQRAYCQRCACFLFTSRPANAEKKGGASIAARSLDVKGKKKEKKQKNSRLLSWLARLMLMPLPIIHSTFQSPARGKAGEGRR